MAHSDDPTIPNSAELWRRIQPDQIVLDENLNVLRPSTAAFSDSSDGTPMSVQLAEIVLAHGGAANSVMVGFEGALAGFTAGFARNECAQGVEKAPLPKDPAHTYVFGKKTGSVKKKFALKGSKWVIPPKTS